jgi:hypothetical protein
MITGEHGAECSWRVISCHVSDRSDTPGLAVMSYGTALLIAPVRGDLVARRGGYGASLVGQRTMTDKIAILGLVIALLSGVAVPVGLAMLDRDATSGAAPPGSGNVPEPSGGVSSTAPPTSVPPDDSSGGTAAPSATFDGKTLELAEDSYADLDSGKVDDDELFRREADIALRSLDLSAAGVWDYDSPVKMTVADGVTSSAGCTKATRAARQLSDQDMRVGTKVCVRSTRGRMFLLQVEQLPTYDTQPPVLVLRVA